MAVFNDIFNRLLPNDLAHVILELTDRLKWQQFLGIVSLALCTSSFQAHVGQAGIGGIHQVQVSNHSLVPQHAVIRQPQMLFLVLDQHLDGPTLEIVGDNGFHRSAQVIRNQRNMFCLSPATREDDFNRPQFPQVTHPFGQVISFGFKQAGDLIPPAAITQNISAIFTQAAFDLTHLKPPIRLAHADIMPVFSLAGSHHHRAQIEGVKQNRQLEFLRQGSLVNRFGGQFGELAEGDFQLFDLFFLDVQPRTPGNNDTPIKQTDLEDGMTFAVLAGGMMMQFADGVHLLGPLESLGIVDNEVTMTILPAIETLESIQSNFSYDPRFLPGAAPKKLAMIGSMGRAPQSLDESFNSSSVTDGDGHHQRPKMAPGGLGKVFFQGPKKIFDFFGNAVDSKHKASLPINLCFHYVYRQERPFLLDVFNHQNPQIGQFEYFNFFPQIITIYKISLSIYLLFLSNSNQSIKLPIISHITKIIPNPQVHFKYI